MLLLLFEEKISSIQVKLITPINHIKHQLIKIKHQLIKIKHQLTKIRHQMIN